MLLLMITLKEVSKFINKIESMAENINLSLFNEFFESLPVGYAKYLINLKNTEENKKVVTKAENRISDLKDNKKYERKRKKKLCRYDTKDYLRNS